MCMHVSKHKYNCSKIDIIVGRQRFVTVEMKGPIASNDRTKMPQIKLKLSILHKLSTIVKRERDLRDKSRDLKRRNCMAKKRI